MNRASKSIKIPALMSVLRAHYGKTRAPVMSLMDSRGNTPFEILVATILSARTLDQTTGSVCRKMFRVVRTPADLRRIPLKKLEKLVYPAGFYRVKARHLKALPAELDRLFGGRIPDTAAELMRLPGVGLKTANLVAAQAFNRAEICVDIHVHRISNRLGLVSTRSPEQTEAALRAVFPRKYWRELNHLLVAFGQTICRPVSPKCGQCPLKQSCRYANSEENGEIVCHKKTGNSYYGAKTPATLRRG